VETQVVDDRGRPVEAGTPGDLEIRGPSVFAEYWRRAEATAEAFRDGWFRSGDVAVVEDGGYYRLLGRRSVDIIKTGGFKVSALEIEEVLREHPAIGECAVVGIDDEEWGERVCVAVEASGAQAVPPMAELQAWARQRLAPYKLPRDLHVVASLPRNAMGKVVKPEVAKLFAQR
jgi:malonyl-CoA/methylmalonyl-CoA synthetase